MHKKTAIFIFSGLGSERTGPGDGFREFGSRIENALGNGSEAFYFPYSDTKLFTQILSVLRSGEFECIVLIGHSFGGSIIFNFIHQFEIYWSINWTKPPIDLVVLFDPAPDSARDQRFSWFFAQWFEFTRWALPTAMVKRAQCFWQHKQTLLGLVGLCGCPIRTVPGLHMNSDVTKWPPNGLTHNEIPFDPRVQAITIQLILEAASPPSSIESEIETSQGAKP